MASRLEKRVLGLGRAIMRAFQGTEAQIANIVRVSISEGANASTRMTRRAEVAALINDLDSTVMREAPAVVEQAFDLGRQIADSERWTRRFEADERFNAFDREAMRILSDNLVSQLHDATQTVGRRTDDIFRRVGLRTTLETYARGEVPHAFNTDLLERRLRQQGLTSFVDSLGRQWDLTRYSEMAIHTIRSEAANKGIANRMLARGFEIYTVNNPETACKQCQPYVGKEWSLVEGVVIDGVEYEVADRLAPYHPKCECFILPSVVGVRNRRDREEAAA